MPSGGAQLLVVSTYAVGAVPPKLPWWTAPPLRSSACGSPALRETPSHHHSRHPRPQSLALIPNCCAPGRSSQNPVPISCETSPPHQSRPLPSSADRCPNFPAGLAPPPFRCPLPPTRTTH